MRSATPPPSAHGHDTRGRHRERGNLTVGHSERGYVTVGHGERGYVTCGDVARWCGDLRQRRSGLRSAAGCAEQARQPLRVRRGRTGQLRLLGAGPVGLHAGRGELPRTSQAQAAVGAGVSQQDLQAGFAESGTVLKGKVRFRLGKPDRGISSARVAPAMAVPVARSVSGTSQSAT